jgi:hypothetical protein
MSSRKILSSEDKTLRRPGCSDGARMSEKAVEEYNKKRAKQSSNSKLTTPETHLASGRKSPQPLSLFLPTNQEAPRKIGMEEESPRLDPPGVKTTVKS